MSGEFVMMQSRWPQYEDGGVLEHEAARAVMLERARALSTSDATRLYGDWYWHFSEHWSEVEELVGEEYDERVAAIVRDRLVAAVEAICAGGLHADCTLALFAGEALVLTGAMSVGEAWVSTRGVSYGEAPTAVYDDVLLVAESGICEAPVVRSGAVG